MTDNEKLAKWQGYKQHPNGVSCYTGELRLIGGALKWPDYLNDDAAAMSLLDTLVSKGFEAQLQSDVKLWWVDIYNYEVEAVSPVAVSGWKSVRRAAVVAACLELIGKGDV